MARKILIIDGDYFAHRAISSLNREDNVNNLETEHEKENFAITLNNQLYSLCEKTSHIFDNYIFVRDNNSWRKTVAPHIPYYSKNLKKQVFGYKENRAEKKEESTINDANYKKVYREFTDSLKSKMMVFDIKGLEGDDNIFLLSQKLQSDVDLCDTIFCVFGNDIDLTQSVVGNFIIFRNISSKASPDGEVVISKDLHERVFKKNETPLQAMLRNNDFENDVKKIITMNIFSNRPIERTIENESLKIAEPFKLAFLKMFAGDDKDNIFSIIGWQSKTGTLNYSLTEKKLISAFEKLHNNNIDIAYNCDECKKIITTKEMLENFVKILLKETKQDESNYNSVIANLKHNMRMKLLSKQIIPSELIAEFDANFNEYKKEIIDRNFDIDKVFSKLEINRKDKSKRMLESEIPDELKFN